jgi:hypothetical protein
MAIRNSLKILNDNKTRGLFDIPKIDPQDRKLLFEVTHEDKEYLNKQTIICNKK